MQTQSNLETVFMMPAVAYLEKFGARIAPIGGPHDWSGAAAVEQRLRAKVL